MLTSIAVVLLSLWVILDSQGQATTTLSLILGIVAGVLALIDLIRPHLRA